jgi:ATP-dependent Clp protease adaptor protein ClpS
MSIFEKERMGKAVTKIKPVPNLDLKEPPMFKVIYINDDVTTMEFVILTLVDFFNHTEESAKDLTVKIHEEGSAVVAILPYEMAEQRGVEVTHLARTEGFPLTIKLEPDA